MQECLATILNVNDHEPTRHLVTRMLERAGYAVIEAGCGEDALRMAAAQPDLIVLDIKLPDISGFEICRMLKGRPEYASIVVLQTSATYTTTEKKVQGLDSGADGYLTHPFEATELVAHVKSLLRLRTAEKALRVRAEQLSVADRRKDEFLAMLAHELRNPLAAMTSAVPLIPRYGGDDPRLRRVCDVLERQTKHLARLIDDLLDVSRITRGKIELRRSVVDLCEIIREASNLCANTMAAQEQLLELRLPPVPTFVEGDAARLQQVFSNLLDNASKYTDRGGRIEVSVRPARQRDRDGVSVLFRDNGIGIAADVLPHIFELFVQADESLARTRGGMGIGLTLVRRLVELHGGSIWARSRGPGEGSEFELWLPLAAGAPQPVTATAPRSEVAPVSGACSILLIDDNEDALVMLEAFLSEAGFHVAFARDGISGVKEAVAGAYDVAIVDIGLPGMDGYEVAERIRAESGDQIRLIALTGYGGPEPQRRALGAGFDRHLVKPIDPDLLLQVVNEVCVGRTAAARAEGVSSGV